MDLKKELDRKTIYSRTNLVYMVRLFPAMARDWKCQLVSYLSQFSTALLSPKHKFVSYIYMICIYIWTDRRTDGQMDR